MSTYKVAQDVEADDKLLGPFSFRQFIYLIIVAGAGFIAYALGKLLLPLALLPMPVILFFGALALPLRKDQPMETYIAALISFYLKPRKRLWQPDGIETLVEITVPKTDEDTRTKDLSQNEAERRLSYLADIADTRGWSIRNISAPPSQDNTSMIQEVFNDSNSVQDIMDDQGYAARNFDNMISAADTKRREDAMSILTQTIPASATTSDSAPSSVAFSPYPTSMQQSIIQPLSDDNATPASQSPSPTVAPNPTAPASVSTSNNTTDPDIIKLASNSDLSIETIAREAERIKEKEKNLSDGEVVISLR